MKRRASLQNNQKAQIIEQYINNPASIGEKVPPTFTEKQITRLQLAEFITQQELSLIEAQYQALVALNNQITKRLGEVPPDNLSSRELVTLALATAARLQKAMTEQGGLKASGFQRLRFEVLKRDGFTCRYCGRTPTRSGVELQVDHVLPRARGGKDELDNLITACADCNQGKADLLLSQDEIERMRLPD